MAGRAQELIQHKSAHDRVRKVTGSLADEKKEAGADVNESLKPGEEPNIDNKMRNDATDDQR